jgi:hypothetical protein
VSGAITNTLRQEALERIKALAVHNDWNIVIEDHVPFETYCDLVSRSKVTLSIAGSRWECFRHYEAVALGSLPLMNVPTIDAHWWKDAPRDLFFQNHFDDFERRIEALLNDGELRQHCRNYLENMVENKLLLSRVVDFIFAISLQSLQKTRET